MSKKKMSKKAESIMFLGIVAIVAVIAVIIVEYQINKPQNYNSPALLISKERTLTTTAGKTTVKPATKSNAK